MEIKNLFKNLCCSICKANFDEESIQIIREENNLLVINLKCQKCGKDFGTSFLGLKNGKKALSVIKGEAPINYDDIINAHKFINELSNDWEKYLK